MEILSILIFIATVILTFVTASVARKKGRSGIGWFLLACIISPYITLIILACIGETDEMRRERIYGDEALRREIRRKVARDEEGSADKASFPSHANRTGKTINDLYKR